jgi:uncharacterized protein (DUF1778 family)
MGNRVTSTVVSTRVSADERRLIEAAVAAKGTDVSTLTRSALLAAAREALRVAASGDGEE